MTNQPQGMLTTNQVQTFQNNWINATQAMGEAVTAATQAQTTAMTQALDGLSKTYIQMLRDTVPALLSARYVTQNLGTPPAAPMGGCSSAQISRQLGQGIDNVAATRQVFNQVLAQYNASTTSAAMAVARAANAPTNSYYILPPANTASAAYPSASAAANYIALVTNPLPPVQLASWQKSTPSGVQWQALVHAQTNQIALAQHALSWLASNTQPTMDAAPFESLWAQSQLPGTMPGVSQNAPGRAGVPSISRDMAMQVVTNSFFANPDFQKKLTQSTQSNLVKTAAMLQSAASAQDLQSLTALEYLVALEASRYAASLRPGIIAKSVAESAAQSINP